MEYYYINDHLFTPQKMIDVNGNVVWQADWDSFGTLTVTINTIENNLRFPWQYYDSETGFYYNFHRYYMPEVGRYLREDEVKNKWDFNLYVYVGGNPVMNVDNRGELSCNVWCRNYVISANAGAGITLRLLRWAKRLPLSWEYGNGYLSCEVCGKPKCYFYSFMCFGGGIGLPYSGTGNFEAGWWCGDSIRDFSGFSFQGSGNFSPGLGTSFSYITGVSFSGITGHGETAGFSGGVSGGLSLMGCITWDLMEINCEVLKEKGFPLM